MSRTLSGLMGVFLAFFSLPYSRLLSQWGAFYSPSNCWGIEDH